MFLMVDGAAVHCVERPRQISPREIYNYVGYYLVAILAPLAHKKLLKQTAILMDKKRRVCSAQITRWCLKRNFVSQIDSLLGFMYVFLYTAYELMNSLDIILAKALGPIGLGA